MLRRLVLPAPLGPMTDSTSPLGTSRLTWLTACTPPNDLETSRISTSALTTATACRRRGPRRASGHSTDDGPSRCRSEPSRQPPLAPAVVLHVAVALALPHSRESQVK